MGGGFLVPVCVVLLLCAVSRLELVCHPLTFSLLVQVYMVIQIVVCSYDRYHVIRLQRSISVYSTSVYDSKA